MYNNTRYPKETLTRTNMASINEFYVDLTNEEIEDIVALSDSQYFVLDIPNSDCLFGKPIVIHFRGFGNYIAFNLTVTLGENGIELSINL